MKRKDLLCLLLIYTFTLGWLAPFAPAQNQTTTLLLPPQNSEQSEKKGLQIRLRESRMETENRENLPPAVTENLSQAETNAVLRRLPLLAAEPDDATAFKFLPNSLPPPRTGSILPVKFPADDARQQQQTAPNVPNANYAALEVVRFSPDGNVASPVSDLSVTFSQPMISIASQAEASENVPIRLTPEVKGRWRWLGTKTLIFDAENRFPMATKFIARVPAGTKSAIGNILQKDVSWTFSTAPPKVLGFTLNNRVIAPDPVEKNITMRRSAPETFRRDELILASFDQDIERSSVLAKISAKAEGFGLGQGKKIPLRLASESEIAADENIKKAIEKLSPNRWIVFRAVDLLPGDARVTITFETGTPSAEGALTTEKPQIFSFKTFGALRLEKAYCGYDENAFECAPSAELRLRFNNELDEKNFDKSQIRIEPTLDEPDINVYDNEISIQGKKSGRRMYKVTISNRLRDKFGQTLGGGENGGVSANFRIGLEEPSLYAEGENLVTVDPNAAPSYSIYSTNYKSLRVKLYAVKPEDYAAFHEYKSNGDEAENLPAFGKLVFDKSINVKSAPDEAAETKIDLRPALSGANFGHLVIVVEPPVLSSRNDIERSVKWIQATQIGIDAFADDENLTVFTSDLKDGKPLAGTKVSLLSGSSAKFSSADEKGIATIELPEIKNIENSLLVARRGEDTAILSEDNFYGETDWRRQPQKDHLRWFVFTDRAPYRPGETVSVKGYVRKIAGGKYADVDDLDGATNSLNYFLKDPRGNEILRGTANLNAFGAFDFQIKLPAKGFNLGSQRLELSASSPLYNHDFTHNFQVLEFRRPEFEVSARVETPAPFFVGDSAVTAAVEAKYYSGGFLSSAETNWTVTATPINYTPSNREDFSFGKFEPWWGDDDSVNGQTTIEEFKGSTGADGKHRIALDFISANPPRAFSVNAEARVQDVNRQTFAASTTLLVHPSKLYVGLKTPKNFVAPGERVKVETIATDIDGKAAANAPIIIVAELKDWKKIEGEWQEVTIDAQNCRTRSGTDGAASCDFTAKQGGVFKLTASVADNRGRRNESEFNVWVWGGNFEPSSGVEKEEARLIPDKKDYAPGDIAEILVMSPFPAPAEGVLTLQRNGVVRVERFTMHETSMVVRVPIEEGFLPNVHAQVDLIGSSPRIFYEDAERDARLPKRPAFASGELNLKISTASRRLNVTAEPIEKTLEPGGATKINVSVKDSQGNPAANSEVALVVVDESVLALTNYKIADPVDVFYQEIEEGVNDYHSRENVLLATPSEANVKGFGYGSGNGMGGGSGGGGTGYVQPPAIASTKARLALAMQDESYSPEVKKTEQIKLRTNFDALAIFAPTVLTDANGNAVVSVNLPDNLTRYRVTAIVAAKNSKQFGTGESNITAHQPLMIRPSAPRFMNFGDRIELPVVVQNQTDSAMTVDLAVRAANANLTAGDGRRITIEANDRAEIRFPVAADKAGTARFQFGATSGKFADAAEIELPVYTPATGESFATYGTTDASGAIFHPIQPPRDVFSQFGGLEITTSSTQLQELTDAFIYLQNYPFECSEQISSRVLSVAALRDVLKAFDARGLPSEAQIEAKMKADIERLQKLQHADGGFSFWRSDDASLPFVSAHVAHAFARAAKKGYAVPPEMLEKSKNYLKGIEAKYPSWYNLETRRAISAYALYVRDLLGEKDAGKAQKLLRETETLEKLSPESIGWILSILADDRNSTAQVETLKRHLLNRVTETAGAAHFVTNYADEGEYVLLSSERRADGVILEALLKTGKDAATDELIPKIVRGLLANRTKGRWQSTQENVFILLALDIYFETFEKVTPNFVARVWLGQGFAGEQNFKGRSIEANRISVPMNYLPPPPPPQNLILDKQGEGRLYYRIGLNYAPKNLRLGAADYGFTVNRTYEAIDDKADVKRNAADGSWTIKPGARVRVRLQMVVPARRYHVALVDRLPAGLEIINPELAVSEKPRVKSDDEPPPPIKGGNYDSDFYRQNWFDHQNLRDERAEVFCDLLVAGVWTYTYFARATTSGEFVAPPAKAEEMYAPETYGRSETDFVRVE